MSEMTDSNGMPYFWAGGAGNESMLVDCVLYEL